MTTLNTPRPAFIAETAYVADITDVWQEATDPEAEHGEACDALFSVEATNHGGHYFERDLRVAATLLGLRVDDGHGVSYPSREKAMGMLGYETVCSIEAAAESDFEDAF